MKVKEKYSNEFKNEDVLKENEKYVALEYGITKNKRAQIYKLKDKEKDEVIFEFQVPNPFYCDKAYEKDLCLRYGHGIRGFILSLFDKISEGKEIDPPYTPDQDSDVIFRIDGRGVFIFALGNPDYQVGFISESEYMSMFIDYFGFRTASVFA